MHRKQIIAIALLVAASITLPGCKKDPVTRGELSGSVETGFAPKLGAQEVIVNAIKTAKTELLIAVSAISSKEIAYEIIAAKGRGVDVKLVADKSQRHDKYSSILSLAEKKVEIRINSKYPVLDTNYMIIDERSVQTGSVNFTSVSLQRQSGNVLVLYGNQVVALAYKENWGKLWNDAEIFEPVVIAKK